MTKEEAIQSAAMFLTRVYTDDDGWNVAALARIKEAEAVKDTDTLTDAIDAVINFCTDLQREMNSK